MKIKDIKVPITIKHDDGTESTMEIAGKYEEIENLSDLKNLQNMSDDDKVRCFNYGRDILERGKIRSANNFGSLARKLYETGVFGSTKEALEFIIHQKATRS